MLPEADWNSGLLELDFLLWLVISGLLPWAHLPLYVPLCWVCRLQLPFACYPHIAGVTWVKLSNSLLSACDAGWCVVPGPLSGLCFDSFFLLLLEWAWLMLSSVGGGWFFACFSCDCLMDMSLDHHFGVVAALCRIFYSWLFSLRSCLVLPLHEGCSCYLYVGSCSLSFIVCWLPYGFCC
jgi:hypothetical protein